MSINEVMQAKNVLSNEAAEFLLTGIDTGNTTVKVSYLNKKGEISSFSIPTVIAPATATTDDWDDSETGETNQTETRLLHVEITSDKIIGKGKKKSYKVGEWAKYAPNRKEPTIIDVDNSKMSNEEIINPKFNSELHEVSGITALAVAAWENGFTEVRIPYSGGLPIKELKKHGTSVVLERMCGVHHVRAISGTYKDKEVTIHIEYGYVHAEGANTLLGLRFDIEKGDYVVTELNEQLGDKVALADLGAGTEDLAMYDENGLNKAVSTNLYYGTNKYIDRILEQITNHPTFEEAKLYGKSPYPTREDLMRKLIIPEVNKMIAAEQEGNEYEMKFIAEWGSFEEDVTEIVTDEMNRYANDLIPELKTFWYGSARVKKMVLVGGGLLFGYVRFREEKNFTFPTKLIDAPYMTSKSYLISNYGQHLQQDM